MTQQPEKLLVATVRLRVDGRWLSRGDTFLAPERDAAIFKLRGFARDANEDDTYEVRELAADDGQAKRRRGRYKRRDMRAE